MARAGLLLDLQNAIGKAYLLALLSLPEADASRAELLTFRRE